MDIIIVMSVSKYYKVAGLCICFLLPLSLYIIKTPFIQSDVYKTLVREALIWGLFGALCLVMKYGENEPFSSLGFPHGVFKSIGVAVIIVLAILFANVIYRIGYHLIFKTPSAKVPMMEKIIHYPVWLRLLLAIRAGIVEETFYRGYAITRLAQLTNNRAIAIIVPLLLFTAGHIAYGSVQFVLGTFVIGAVLTLSYLKTKNLLANIIAHILFDSIALFNPYH